MCKTCEIKTKEIQRLHKVCQSKDAEIEKAINSLYRIERIASDEGMYVNPSDVSKIIQNLMGALG